MLTLARKLAGADASTKAGKWERAKFTGFELFGKTLGLIGMGDIGARVAKRAVAFGMNIIAHDPLLTPTHFAPAEFGATLLPLEAVLQQADFVSIHVPLLPSTRNLLNAERLAMMKSSAIILNSSRGGIIDEVALTQALTDKRIGGAALDVRLNEPPGVDDPLAKFENVLLTPHVAGITEEAQDRICTAVAQDILRVLRGERGLFEVKN
jgi:D-3-phosphoglycerate dehydrogenase/(S)-sulfolactate dehydrogenase